MATHPADRRAANPRIQCSVCAKWRRLIVKPYRSIGGYDAGQTFFACTYTLGEHLAGSVSADGYHDVCDWCCHDACQQIAIARAAG